MGRGRIGGAARLCLRAGVRLDPHANAGAGRRRRPRRGARGDAGLGFSRCRLVRDRSAERRALEARAAELNAESLAPGSPLACLNGLAGDDVEAACEKALFAAPSTVASATSYVAARFALLADMVAYTKRGGGGINSTLLPLRRSLEADRFGFVAHTLAVADRCSSDHCEALALLDNPGQVRANLSGQTLERYLDHYLPVWAKAPDVPVADATSTSGPSAGRAARRTRWSISTFPAPPRSRPSAS